MLVGRRAECAVLDRLLRSHAQAMGKRSCCAGNQESARRPCSNTWLASADGLQVLRTVGNEAERELPFAALQLLCAPGLERVEHLPDPQRHALQVAFGARGRRVRPVSTVLVGLAALSLFSQAGGRSARFSASSTTRRGSTGNRRGRWHSLPAAWQPSRSRSCSERGS